MSTATISENDRSWAINANAAGLLVFTNIPFAGVIAALLVWLRVRNDATMPFARVHARESFNFQATWMLLMLTCAVSFIIALVRGTLPPRSLWAFMAGVLVLVVANVACVIAALVAASDLRPFKYPFAIPFIR